MCRHTTPYSLLANGLLMCRFAAPLAFNFMAAIAIPPSSRHAEGDRDVQDTVRPTLVFSAMRWFSLYKGLHSVHTVLEQCLYGSSRCAWC